MKKCALIIGFVVLLCLLQAGCAKTMPPEGINPLFRTLVVTGYCKCGKCCGWRRTWYGRPVYSGGPNKGKRKSVGVTASGVDAKHGTIAADTSIYPFGTIMYVDGYGYGRVEDRGGDIKGDHIDLFFSSHKKALEWGRKKIKVKIWAKKRD
ncbi:3D domain-containing protein [Verrucomicrobiota bacterium]